MRRSPLPWWWLLALLPTVTSVVHHCWLGGLPAGAFLLQTLPSPLLLIAVALLQRGSTPFCLHVSKEFRLVGSLAILTLTIVAIQRLGYEQGQHIVDAPDSTVWVLRTAAATWAPVGAAVGLCSTAFKAVVGEQSLGTMTTWAMQPRARASLLWFKLGVLAVVVGLELLQVLAGPFLVRTDALLGAVAVSAVSAAPAGVMTNQKRRDLAIILVVALLAAVPLSLVAWKTSGFTVALFGVFIAGLLALSFSLFRRADLSAKPLTVVTVPWLSSAARLVRPGLRKELLSHRVTIVAAVLTVLWWGMLVAFAANLGVRAASGPLWILLLLTVPAALFCGIETFAEARAHDTAVWEEAYVPRSQLLWTKVSTSFGVMVTVCLVLPVLLVAISPGWAAVTARVGPGALFGASMVASGVLGTWALGLAGAAPTSTRTEVAINHVGLATLGVLAILFGATIGGGWLSNQAAWASTTPPSAQGWLLGHALETTPGVFVSLGALWAARRAWLLGRYDRRTLLAPAAIAIAVAGQAFLSARLTSDRVHAPPAVSASTVWTNGLVTLERGAP